MSMGYIRRQYKVPAKRGRRVVFMDQPATIIGTDGPHLRIRVDGQDHTIVVHPTWRMTYEIGVRG